MNTTHTEHITQNTDTDTDTQKHRHTDKQTHKHTNTQTHKHADTQTHRHTDTDNKHTHTRKHTKTRTCGDSDRELVSESEDVASLLVSVEDEESDRTTTSATCRPARLPPLLLMGRCVFLCFFVFFQVPNTCVTQKSPS